jgi:hypothetical protein
MAMQTLGRGQNKERQIYKKASATVAIIDNEHGQDADEFVIEFM